MLFCGMFLLQSFESSHKKYFEIEREHIKQQYNILIYKMCIR